MTVIQDASIGDVIQVIYVYPNGTDTYYIDSLWHNAVDAKAHAKDVRNEPGVEYVYVIPRAVWKRA